jgi:outer membrane lipoprotein-sorting protein
MKQMTRNASVSSIAERSLKVNKLKSTFITVLMVVFANVLGFTMMADAQAQDADEIMKKSHMAYYYAGDDGVAEVNMSIVNDKGKERNRRFTMLRMDESDGGNQKYYIYFYEPSDVKRLTFMVHKSAEGNDKRWIYVPAVDLIKPIAADDKNSSFVGSNFTYEDVSGRLWTEDTHTLLKEDELDAKAAWVIESKPLDAGYGGFARKVSYISQDSWLPLREEYHNEKDELIRVFTAEKVEVIDEIPTITLRKMTDEKKGQYTTVEFSSIQYNQGIKDEVFTERFLKSPPREFVK